MLLTTSRGNLNAHRGDEIAYIDEVTGKVRFVMRCVEQPSYPIHDGRWLEQ